MPDPILPPVPALIAAQIRAALPELTSCEASAGRFDLAALGEIGARDPAVRVGVLGIADAREVSGPQWEPELRLAAMIVTTDRPNLPRDAAALAIAERVIALVLGNRWGSDHLGEPRGIAAENLYTGGTRQRGVALWGVSWRQPFAIRPAPVHAGALPAEWYATGLGLDGQEVLP